jgi:hypothetical protein
MSVVRVTEQVRTGKGCYTTQHWQYDDDKNRHFGGKLGRRVGKHGPQRKAHCTESDVIRAVYHKKEVATGFLQYRQGLARVKAQQRREDSPSARQHRESLILAAKRSRESILCLQPQEVPIMSSTYMEVI